MPSPALTPEKVDRIRALYLADTPVDQIEEIMDVSRPTIYKYLNDAKLTSRYGARPTHTVWHNAFDVLTDEAAYWVGLLITDGSILNGSRRIKLSLQSPDLPTLLRFCAFVRTSAQPGKVEKGSRAVRFSSVVMCQRLAELGIVPRKTHHATAPDCLLGNRHFWRGVVDGDGGIVVGEDGSPGLRITGSSSAPLLSQWASTCDRLWAIRCLVRIRPDTRTVSDAIVNGAPAVRLLHWLYSKCSPASPAMDRKLNDYLKVAALHDHRPITSTGKYAWGSRKKCST